MSNKRTRREFLQDSAAVSAGLGVAGELTIPRPTVAADNVPEERIDWRNSPDRVWLGPQYWANPLQDWRIAAGRIECINAALDRNVHLLTQAISEEAGDATIRVTIGRLGEKKISAGKGSAGFRIGIVGPLREYRNNLAYGKGLDAGITADGKLFIGDLMHSVEVDLSGESIDLILQVESSEKRSKLTLTAMSSAGTELAKLIRDDLEATNLAGNIALVANFASPAPRPKNAVGGQRPANVALAGLGEFYFADWRVSGSRVSTHEDHAFGPILFNHYSLSRGTLKMTAQMPPLGAGDSQTVRLQVYRDQKWIEVAEEQIHPQARTATFRIESWDDSQDTPYRLAYKLLTKHGSGVDHFWPGTIRRDPVDQPMLTVADVSCNIHDAFPNTDYTAKMARLNPDLLAFVGDQFYENTGGYGVTRMPLEPAILDYLRKWYFHGWTWRELTRDRPSISIPDDHDVYQGNIWGEGGAPQHGTQEQGGYNMPAAWVNVVHRTQTSHHPDPWDATPCKQGISVYSGPLVYGRISFAILADRQFKSAPEGHVPPTGGRGDHVTDPNFDPKSADLPGLQLLGPGQLQHLRAWTNDWIGAEMKAVISQTIFTAMATTHGGPNGRLVADYDTNGWPQAERNAALREIRRSFSLHIAGDQHLPAVVHYGVDEHRDAGFAFAGPAVNTGYPRWFEPLVPGANRAPGAAENTGDFRDSFGNPLTVIALANGAKQPRASVLEKLHDKVSGLGLVRFDKKERKITLECWPFLADPTQSGTQFPGWPVTIDVLSNYGRKHSAQLPQISVDGIKQPVIAVIDEANGELVYTLRLATNRWQPQLFATGTYTVRISEPETGKSRELTGLQATPNNGKSIQVKV